MNAHQFRTLLQALLTGIAEGDSDRIEESIDILSELFETRRTEIVSFQNAGLLTRDEGIVIDQGCYGSVQISVVAARGD
ncbi:MAG: hypothetical protein HQM04_17825 [Magnetococcales bacterium]|nr:hypothetical protein [Magnetococcales bacterium]MBF0116889.1 hypothetical protein [Magnetococcales bacterium]